MTGPVLHVVVHGTPAPQGSKRHVGRGVMVESSKKLLPWREAVKAAAWEARRDYQALPLFARRVPVEVEGAFYLTRPKLHFRSDGVTLRDGAPEFVTVKPDIDKVQRSTFDALVDAAVLAGDEQIVRVALTMRYGPVAGADLLLQEAR